MLDLNRLLLFVALLSPAVILVRTARRAALNRSWQMAAGIVLIVTALAWLIAPGFAGFVGGGAWLCLLFVPAVGLRRAGEMAVAERYTAARRIVAALRWLHPGPGVREELRFVSAMEAAQKGDTERAVQLLQSLRAADNRAGLQVIAQSFRIRGDWPGLLAWCRHTLPVLSLNQEPAVLPLYLRGLGESGAIDDLVLQVAARAPRLLASPQSQTTFDLSVLMMFAFSGRTESLARLLKTRFRSMPSDTREFWLGTSELAAGQSATGRARLEGLRGKTRDALIRADIAARLGNLPAGSVQLAPLTETTVRRFEKNIGNHRAFAAAEAGFPPPAVATIIALNVAMFLLELASGGATNTYTLQRLGALEPFAVLARGEWWRLLSALFLHYGALHLFMNLYALYVLGPALERALGSLRFALCYLAAGVGSSAGVVLLWRFGITEADLLVGASGAIMGVVGTWAGLLLRNHHLPMARRRLLTIGVIVLMQTMFDFYTPQISMAAHLCGLGAGLIAGLLLAPRDEAW